MKLNVYLFLYEKFVDFEVIQALFMLRESKLITVSFESGLVKSIGNLKVHADISIGNLDPAKVDLFLIPGGEPKEIIRDESYSDKIAILNQKLQALHKNKKIIAAICGGPTFLANAGILDGINCTASIADDEKQFYKKSNFSDEDVVIADNVITAQGQAFTLFAGKLARMCGVIKTDEEMKEAVNWFRNI
ncbi:MAG: hypothetical protein FK730_15310 [Asgard group archaeon]|nr:hypothetical protein [Asgard group archaeon]